MKPTTVTLSPIGSLGALLTGCTIKKKIFASQSIQCVGRKGGARHLETSEIGVP